MPFTYNNIVMASGSVTAVPTANTDLANKLYVDNQIAAANTDLTTLQSDVAALQSDVSSIQTTIASVPTDISTLQSDVTALQSDVSTLQSDVSSIQTTLTSVPSDISTLQSDVAGLQSDVSSLQTDVSTLQSNLVNAPADIAALQTDVLTIQSTINDLQDADTTLQSNIDAINNNVFGSTSVAPGTKIPLASLAVSPVAYRGTWNATTNTPDLTQSGVKVQGSYYVVNVAGSTDLNGLTDWKVGDWAIYNGSAWEKVDNTDAVTSVAGKTGAVTLVAADITDLSSNVATSVAGRTGAVTLAIADITDFPTDYVTSVAGKTGDVTLESADIADLPAVVNSLSSLQTASTNVINVCADFAVPNTADNTLHFVETTVMGRDDTVSHTVHDTFAFKFKTFVKNVGGTLSIVGQEVSDVQASTANNVIDDFNGAVITYSAALTIVSNNVHIALTQSGPITTTDVYNTIKVSQYTTITTLST